MHFLVVVLSIFLLTSCTKVSSFNPITYEKNLNNLDFEAVSYKDDGKSFLNELYRVWSEDFGVSEDEALWPWRAFSNNEEFFKENYKPYEKTWFDKKLDNANFEEFLSQNKNAIIVNKTDVRVFPTDLAIFKNPNLLGEGYPFDYNQNSAIYPFTPIKLSHFSKDKMWAFIKSDSYFGWIKSNTFLTLSKDLENKIVNSKKSTAVKPMKIFNQEGVYAILPIGTIIPMEDKSKAIFPISSNEVTLLELDPSFIKDFPLNFDEQNRELLLNEFLNEPYGWGGLHGFRDCSAMTKDFFTPFGIWLPRNSYAQYFSGAHVDISALSNSQKLSFIKKHATPYLTLIYQKGHIMLYVGTLNGEVLVAHNMWGIRRGFLHYEYMEVVGKTIVSNLFLGDGHLLTKKSNLLINKIEGISTQNPISPANRLLLAYKDSIKKIEKNTIFFHNGIKLPFSSNEALKEDSLLENPDIKSQFLYNYPKFADILPPLKDPGRIRNEEFFKALYGENEKEIRKSLVKVKWLPSHMDKVLLFNERNGAANALKRVSLELDKLDSEYISFLNNPSGTFNYRKIDGTNRLSAHSFGIAIDINVKSGDYWRWSKDLTYKNQIPKTIVDIFEKHGFIWGGRWKHFDTLHFEYRPELTLP